jgi:hypothetical protein
LPPTSPQPNVLSAGAPFGFSPWFWLLVVVTGIGAGIGGGLLMALLRAVQHLSWSYSAGTFLAAVEQVGWQQRIAVLVLAGVLVGTVRWLWKQQPGGHAGELAEAIWFRCGRLPFARTLGRPFSRSSLSAWALRSDAKPRPNKPARRSPICSPIGHAFPLWNGGCWWRAVPEPAWRPSTTCRSAARCSRSKFCWARWRSH